MLRIYQVTNSPARVVPPLKVATTKVARACSRVQEILSKVFKAELRDPVTEKYYIQQTLTSLPDSVFCVSGSVPRGSRIS
jgi:hypothetical protein